MTEIPKLTPEQDAVVNDLARHTIEQFHDVMMRTVPLAADAGGIVGAIAMMNRVVQLLVVDIAANMAAMTEHGDAFTISGDKVKQRQITNRIALTMLTNLKAAAEKYDGKFEQINV